MPPKDDPVQSAGRQDAAVPKSGVRSAGFQPASACVADDVVWRSRGHLPHLDAPNLVQHIVFRLGDSLPAAVIANLGRRATNRIGAFDATLDQGHGGCDLANPVIAELVETALLAFDAERYRLFAWCVMPNHVHTLLEPLPGHRLDRIVHSWKSYTAKEANRLLGRAGPFWVREYFDRFMRDEKHLVRTAAYIDGNPAKAGLCDDVSKWRFSSAWRGWAGETPALRAPSAGKGDALPAMARILHGGGRAARGPEAGY